MKASNESKTHTTLEQWVGKLASSRIALDGDELKLMKLVTEFERDSTAWELWSGEFDRLLAVRCGIDPARYRAYQRAISVVADQIDHLGMEGAVALNRISVDGTELSVELYKAVANRVRFVRGARRITPTKSKAQAIVREEARRLGILPEVRPRNGALSIAVGCLERIATGVMSKDEMAAAAGEALRDLDSRAKA